MNKRKNLNFGFTLVELLAVIVILALIVVIAVSALGDNVEKSNEKSLKINANKYVNAVNDMATMSIREDVKYETGTYNIGDLPEDSIKLSGTKPSSGYVVFDDFEVVDACLRYDTFTVTFKDGKADKVVEHKKCVPTDTSYIATETPTVVYDYNISNYTFPTNTSYMVSGYTVNFDKDFKLELTASLPKSASRYLFFGNYSNTNYLNIEVNANNKLRVCYKTGDVSTSTDSVTFGHDVKFVFDWDADTKSYTFTATGNGTNATTTGTISAASGTINGVLRLGQDYRGGSTFIPYTIKSLKITETYNKGDSLSTMPIGVSRDNYTFGGWFTGKTNGDSVTPQTIIGDRDMTYYVHWSN